MRVSQAYGLGRNQSCLDFLDINLVRDIPVYLDASSIRTLDSPWGHELTAFLDSFFGLVLKSIKAGKHDVARSLLASLRERNEYHLGVSAKESRGRAFGEGSAEDVWDALASHGKIAKLLTNIEDSILMVWGVGNDMVSDAICNILKDPFIRFTQEACNYYGIPLSEGVDSGPMWNIENECWEHALVSLPCHEDYGRFVLEVVSKVRIEACTALVDAYKQKA